MATGTASPPYGGFTPLPLLLPAPKAKIVYAKSKEPLPQAVHWTYIAPHEPRITTVDTSRSLLATNVPIDANEGNLRSLFANHLGGARIERVDFDCSDVVGGAIPSEAQRRAASALSDGDDQGEKRGRKRKRHDAHAALQAPEAQFPHPPRELQVLRSASNAVLVFVDEASQQSAMKAVKRAAAAHQKHGRLIPWESGMVTGLARYKALHAAKYPDPKEILTSVTNYLTAYQEVEAEEAKEQARKGGVPDAEGFVTVTKGSTRSGVARAGKAEESLQKQQKREEERIGDNFYRFQVREKAKERERELRRQFQEDVRKVEQLKERRRAQRRG